MRPRGKHVEQETDTHLGMPAGGVFLLILATVLFCGTACEDAQRERELKLEKQGDLARKKIRKLTEDIETLSAAAAVQTRQIRTLQKLGPKRLKYLFTVDKIELGRYTGGIDTDKKPGQDAVKVFLLPKDKTGSILKAAGSVKIQLFDLALPKGENLIAEFIYPVEKIGKYWSAGMLANHYSFECPFPQPPLHEKITVRVEFIDYLMGRTFSAQKLCHIILPPRKKS